MADRASPEDRERVREALDELRHAEHRLAARRRERHAPSALERRAVRYIHDRAAHGDPATHGELGDHFGTSPATTSVLVQRLCDRGWVSVATHPVDGRKRLVLPAAASDDETLPQLIHDLVAHRDAASARAIAEFLEDLRDRVDGLDA